MGLFDDDSNGISRGPARNLGDAPIGIATPTARPAVVPVPFSPSRGFAPRPVTPPAPVPGFVSAAIKKVAAEQPKPPAVITRPLPPGTVPKPTLAVPAAGASVLRTALPQGYSPPPTLNRPFPKDPGSSAQGPVITKMLPKAPPAGSAGSTVTGTVVIPPGATPPVITAQLPPIQQPMDPGAGGSSGGGVSDTSSGVPAVVADPAATAPVKKTPWLLILAAAVAAGYVLLQPSGAQAPLLAGLDEDQDESEDDVDDAPAKKKTKPSKRKH